MKNAFDTRYLFFSGILAVYCLCMLLGCSRADAITEKEPKPVRPVKAMKLENLTSIRTHTFPGIAAAIREVDLSFRIRGPLIRFDLETGRHVTKGQVLAGVDPRDFEIRVEKLTAKLTASRAQKEEARLQFKRHQNLIKAKGVAKAQLDRTKATYETAVAQVDADEKNLEDARNALADTVLMVPFSGFVHEVYVENHETVDAGRPVISLVDLSGIELHVDIPEGFLAKVPAIDSFSCTFDAFPGERFKATFKEVGKRPNPSNQSYPMILTLLNDYDSNTFLIRPGMTGEITAILSDVPNEHLFTVPVTSVMNDNNRRSFVWVFDPDTECVNRRYVNTRRFVRGGVEISGNISPGNWVVTAGAQHLSDSQKVRILSPPSETNVGNLL